MAIWRKRLNLSAAALLLLGGCAAPAPAFRVVSAESVVVEWRRGGETRIGPVRLERGEGATARVVVNPARPALIVTRSGGRWIPERSGWPAFYEAWEGAAHAPAGLSEVRTARFVARYEKSGDRLVALELVDVATGERFRARFD